MTPVEVRRQRFPLTGLGRRGLSPTAVARFLGRVQADLTVLYAELVEARDQAERYRQALRDWQSQRWRADETTEPRGGEYRRPAMWPPYSRRQPGSQPGGRPKPQPGSQPGNQRRYRDG
ncbi:DivIVA domain-containing protein [Micromonospora sp. NPDC000207]|uniref:DivIVA domain-containing protein n=1 Tax=Micromonospora sp. NPDC000207 TaxID=3154246 RepID=UPI00332BD4D0